MQLKGRKLEACDIVKSLHRVLPSTKEFCLRGCRDLSYAAALQGGSYEARDKCGSVIPSIPPALSCFRSCHILNRSIDALRQIGDHCVDTKAISCRAECLHFGVPSSRNRYLSDRGKELEVSKTEVG